MELFEAPHYNEPDAVMVPAIQRWLNTADNPDDVFFAVVFARMSELPIQRALSRFIEKVRAAGDKAAYAASDRGDPDVLSVLEAARKVQVEIHRITGFLRFSPDSQGVYIARCEPDYFILPALAEHFTLRFGETAWAIIDEKRRLCLSRQKGGEARIMPVSADSLNPPDLNNPADAAAKNRDGDCWEDLWRLYHRSVSNESRKNVKLQRQFIPKRYHKHLNEL